MTPKTTSSVSERPEPQVGEIWSHYGREFEVLAIGTLALSPGAAAKCCKRHLAGRYVGGRPEGLCDSAGLTFIRGPETKGEERVAGRFPPQAGDVWRHKDGHEITFTGKYDPAPLDPDAKWWRGASSCSGYMVGCIDRCFTDGTLTFVRHGNATPVEVERPALGSSPFKHGDELPIGTRVRVPGWWACNTGFAGDNDRDCTARMVSGRLRLVHDASGRTSGPVTWADDFVLLARVVAESPSAFPASTLDTDETRQAALLARTDATIRALKIEKGYPVCCVAAITEEATDEKACKGNCGGCHSLVDRVGKSGRCFECWKKAPRANEEETSRYVGLTVARHRVLSRQPAPFVPSIWASDIPDA